MSVGQSSDSHSRRTYGSIGPISTGVTLHPGTRIRGYVVDKFIASGGFGSVYRVHDVAHDRPAALKLLHPELRTLGDSFIRFLREAQVLDRIRHPNIIELFDSGTLPDGRAFVVMELLSGSDVERHIEASGALPVGTMLDILEPVCDALSHAHSHGVIHRDIKASNVFLCEHDGLRRVVLLDFGLAKVIEQGGIDLTSSRMTLGTPSCMSPEQIRGDKVDERADIYALGALSYHMLTGRAPFAGKSSTVVQYMHLHGKRPRPSSLAKVSIAVDDVISRAMASDRDHRFSSVSEFMNALREAESTDKSKRRARRAKHTQRRALAVYVDVRMPSPDSDSDGDDDEALLDAMDSVLDSAERYLVKAGFHTGLEGSNFMLYIRVLSTDGEQEVRERSDAAIAVSNLRNVLDKQLGKNSTLHVNLCMHRDFALVSDGRVQGGELMRLERWAPEGDLAGVVGSTDVFEGLDTKTEPIANSERLVRMLLPPGSADLLHGLSGTEESQHRLLHTQMLAQLGRQIAGIVHDLRSPLTVIQGNLDMVLQILDEGREISSDHQRGLEDAMRATQQLAAMVSTILGASAVKAYGKDQRKMSITEIVNSAVRLSQGETRMKAKIDVYHEGESFVLGSPGRLTQVLVNLIVNAAQAMVKYGSITIRTSTNINGVVQIAIRDTGVGMSEKVQKRMFEPFFTTKDTDKGTGLGLALVRQIIEEHEGTVVVNSTPGVGSCFTIELPSAR